jgi:exopolysaccharide biosynthesis polyprenyl glycosylphosphotransferase
MAILPTHKPERVPERSPEQASAVALFPARAAHGRWEGPSLILSFDLAALAIALLATGTLTSPLGLAYAVTAVLTLAVSQAYRVRITLSALDSAPWLIGRLAIPLVVLAPVVLLVGSDTALFAEMLLAIGLIVVGRVLSYALIRRLRRRGSLLDRTVILGAGQIGAELGRNFLEHPEYGIEPVGFLDCVGGQLPAPLLGDVDSLDRMIERHDIRRVVVAFGPARESELVGVLRTAVRHDVEVHIVPRFFDCGVAPEGPDTDDVRGIPLYRVRRAALRKRAWRAKRFVDIVVAGSALVVTSPIFALAALAVRVTSPGPVFFRQRRVGQDGREIEVPKFRTMRVNSDSDTQWSVADDERLTRVGKILRHTSIDELPQLWSVVRGDMSLVGPRPERPFFVEQFSVDVDGYNDRHRVPAGLTGWAQVHGLRGDTSIRERARFDNHYIEHWSPWRDFVIVLRTLAELTRAARPHKRADDPRPPDSQS